MEDLILLAHVVFAGYGESDPSTLTALYFCGANLNAGDQSHNTPLHLAAAGGYVRTVQQLVTYGALLNATNRWGKRTPLGVAEQVSPPARDHAASTMSDSCGLDHPPNWSS